VALVVAEGVAVGVAVVLGVEVRVAVGVGVRVAVAVLVGVAVGGGAIPSAVPVSFTFCGLFSASSVMDSVPDSLAPLSLAAPVGLNVTDTVQVAGLAASIEPHVFALTAKGPLAMAELMLIAELFGFDNVTLLASDTVSTRTLPNDRSFGLMSIFSPAADAISGAVT
jgi:hypothetical protein